MYFILFCRNAVWLLWSGWRRRNLCRQCSSARSRTSPPRSPTPPSIPWRCMWRSSPRTSSQVNLPSAAVGCSVIIHWIHTAGAWSCTNIYLLPHSAIWPCGQETRMTDIQVLRSVNLIYLQPHERWHIFGNSLMIPLSHADLFLFLVDVSTHQHTANTKHTCVFSVAPAIAFCINYKVNVLFVFFLKTFFFCQCSCQVSHNAVSTRGGTPQSTWRPAVTVSLYSSKCEYFFRFTHLINFFTFFFSLFIFNQDIIQIMTHLWSLESPCTTGNSSEPLFVSAYTLVLLFLIR